METIKDFAPRTKALKDTDNFWTLWQRRYPHIKANYYRKHAEELKQKSRDRYHNDPEYRAKVVERARERARVKKAEKEQLKALGLLAN